MINSEPSPVYNKPDSIWYEHDLTNISGDVQRELSKVTDLSNSSNQTDFDWK